MKVDSEEKYIEGAKFASLFAGFICAYLTWGGLGTISDEMFLFFPKIFPVTLLVLFILTVSELKKVERFFAGGLSVLALIPAMFYFNNYFHLSFYWHIPLSLIFIFLTGKLSFTETHRRLLTYFSGGYIGVMLVKLIMVTFNLGNLELWINKNLIAGATFFACMLTVILIDRMSLDYSLPIEGLVSLVGITVFYLCDSWTPMISYAGFLLISAGIKYNSKIRRSLENSKVWIVLFSVMFLFIPNITYLFAANDGFGIQLSGRVEIWQELFYSWTSEMGNLLIGAGNGFYAVRSDLPAHSAYLDILWRYGIIGYVIFFGGIVLLMFRHKQRRYSTNQLLCLAAFLVTCIHATMENYLSSFQWIPIIFIFPGLLISQSEKASALEKEIGLLNEVEAYDESALTDSETVDI